MQINNKRGEKRLASGRYIDLENLKVEDVDINDITIALNQIKRFSGHYKDREPLTVAQHTLLCLNFAKILFPDDVKIHRATVIHDFGETYYGDIVTQIKRIVGPILKEKIFDPIDLIINKKFWYPNEIEPTDEVHYCVKVCDYLSLDVERRVMWKSQFGKDKWPEVPNVGLSLLDKEAMFDEVANQKFVDLKSLLHGHC